MKACPICSRIYEDDTFTFCLDDGARLSATFDPHSTSRGAAPRKTEPPRTEILPSNLRPINPAPPKRSGTHWIILSATLALGLVGLVFVLGYLAWRANSPSKPAAYSAVPANANRDAESKLPDDSSPQWLDGRWEGEGYQSDTKTTWAVRLTVRDGNYTIEYPNIPCRGTWRLIDKNSGGASFTEVITQGTDLCDNNSHVMLEKINDAEISCKYTHAGSRVVIATATLSKKAQSNDQR